MQKFEEALEGFALLKIGLNGHKMSANTYLLVLRAYLPTHGI